MAVILNSTILNSANLHKKNFTHSTQLDDGSHLVILSCWIQPQPSWIQTPCYLLSDSLKNTLTPLWLHSDSTWWWQPSWILPCLIQTLPFWIQTPYYLLSDSLKNTLTPLCLRLKLIQSGQKKLHSFILTLMMAVILNSAILDSAILNKSLTQTNSIWLKLIHSYSTWWWQPSWIVPSWIQPS